MASRIFSGSHFLLLLIKQRRMVFVQPLQNGSDNGLPHKFGSIAYLIFIDKPTDCFVLFVIEQKSYPMFSFQRRVVRLWRRRGRCFLFGHK